MAQRPLEGEVWAIEGTCLLTLVLSSQCRHCLLEVPSAGPWSGQKPTYPELIITFQVQSFDVICGSHVRKPLFTQVTPCDRLLKRLSCVFL